jgi:hypothetical protein
MNNFTKLLLAAGISASLSAAKAITCPENDAIAKNIDTLAQDGKATFQNQELSLIFFQTTNNNYNNKLVNSKGELLQFLKISHAMTKDPLLKGKVSVLKLDNHPDYCPYKVTAGLNHVVIALSEKGDAAVPSACPLIDQAKFDELKQNGFAMVGQHKYTFSKVGSENTRNLITTQAGLKMLEGNSRGAPNQFSLKVTPMKNLANDGRCLYHLSTSIGTEAGRTGIIALVPAQ